MHDVVPTEEPTKIRLIPPLPGGKEGACRQSQVKVVNSRRQRSMQLSMPTQGDHEAGRTHVCRN
jgi:hypothetical protein